MGVDQVEPTLNNCPYCCNQQRCDGFQEILNLNDTGWVIYRYVDLTENESRVGVTARNLSVNQNAFIVHNPNNVRMVSADLLARLGGHKKIPCPRCRQKIQQAQKMFNTGSFLDSTDVVGVCDHCFLKLQAQETCCKCKKIVSKFLTARGGQQSDANKYSKRWLINMEEVLNKVISEIRTQKMSRRTHSNLDIKLWTRETPESGTKCEVHEMFHSETNLVDDSSEKRRHSKKQTFTLEKVVKFTDALETHQATSSHSNIKVTEEEQDAIARYSGLGPYHSKEDEKYQNEPRDDKEKFKQIPKREGKQIEEYEKSMLYGTDKIIDAELEETTSFVFPHTAPEKPHTKLKQYVSSSELIKDTQEKIRLKAEEEEKKVMEALKLKSLLKEKKKLAREEKGKLARQEKEKHASVEKEKLAREEKEKIAHKEKNAEEGIKTSQASDAIPKSNKKKQEEESKENRNKADKLKKTEDTKEKDLKISEVKLQKQSIDKLSTKVKGTSLDQQNKLKKGGLENELKDKQDTLLSKEEGKLSKKDEFQKESKKPKTAEDKEKDLKISQVKLQKQSIEKLSIKTKSASLEQKNKLKKGGLEEELKDKQETSQLKEKAKSASLEQKNKTKKDEFGKEPVKPEKLEEREKELKLYEVKLQKQSIDKLTAQLGKTKENQSKKSEKLSALLELPGGPSQAIEKYRTDEEGVTDNKKSEKSAKEPQEKDLKMSLMKLQKQSTDNLMSQLVKVNKNESTKQQIKELDVSKLVLETNKAKEARANKALEEPKKKEAEKPPLSSTQETQERNLKMTEVKLVSHSMDSIILKSVRIKSQAEKSTTQNKNRLDGDESKQDLSDDDLRELAYLRKLKRGKPPEFQTPCREGQDVIPLYIRHELQENSSKAPLAKAILASEERSKVDPEASKGIIRYALSDRSFIEKGWTMLPVEKVVRKMNIYRMRPAQPEFDWFEHNKHKGLMLYDTGAKLAEIDSNGRGQWFYQNGRLALDYYEAEETNTQQRFVIYSSGEQDARGRSRPVTILATFDHLGNGVVFDHAGKIRLKFNQTEGVLLDRSIGPPTNWKWHTLNDPPVLQQVMIDTQMPMKDPKILKLGGPADIRTRPDNDEMLAIEFDNFIKEKSKKLTQKFKPFQIRMKALKINEQFSLKVLDQATIYLIFRDGSANLKINIGMILDHKEIVDTDTAELGEVSNSLERFPARTDSLAGMQRTVAFARRYERMRTERDRRLRHPERGLSVDDLGKATSRPLRPPLRLLSTSPTETSTDLPKCSRKPSCSLYYSTQLL